MILSKQNFVKQNQRSGLPEEVRSVMAGRPLVEIAPENSGRTN